MSTTNVFSSKNVLVTGAGKGIGRAIAERLASEGAHVFALSRTEKDLLDLKTKYPGVETIIVDLANWDETKAALEVALGNTHIHIVINNAAVADAWTPLLQSTEETFDRVFNVNLKAVLNVSQFCAQRMIDEKINKGRIVNISTVGAFRPFPISPLYSASKAGLDMLTKLMAVEWGKFGIRVNSVNLGYVQTPMTEGAFGGSQGLSDIEESMQGAGRLPLLKALIPLDQVVDSVLFLASPEAPSMLTGSSIVLDGGISLS